MQMGDDSWCYPAQRPRTPSPGHAPQLVLARAAAETRATQQRVASVTARASNMETVVPTSSSSAPTT